MVIDRYSTSFGLASRLLTKDTREHIRNVYALVRVADEVVDGPATEAGLDHALARTVLDELEADTERAMAFGFSVNPVVHAFARTARTDGLRGRADRAVLRVDADGPRTDRARPGVLRPLRVRLGRGRRTDVPAAFVYRAGRPTFDEAVLVDGARALGAAFQKVNFLRDLHADFEVLGRSYFPGVDLRSFDEPTKRRLVADVQDDLDRAARTVRLLPADAQKAVGLAHALFQELNDRIAATPADRLVTSRVRVPNPVKARLARRCSPDAHRCGPEPPPTGREAPCDPAPRLPSDRPHLAPRGAGPSRRGSSAAASADSRPPRCSRGTATPSRCSSSVTTRRPRRVVGAGRLPVRHRPVVVPHARGVRPLLPAARHQRRRRDGPGAARPRLPRLQRGARRAARPARRPRGQHRVVRVHRARAGDRMRKYLDSAADTYAMAVRRFLYTTFQDLTKLAAPDVLRRLPKLSPSAAPAAVDLRVEGRADRRLWQVLGYPAVFLGRARTRHRACTT